MWAKRKPQGVDVREKIIDPMDAGTASIGPIDRVEKNLTLRAVWYRR